MIQPARQILLTVTCFTAKTAVSHQCVELEYIQQTFHNSICKLKPTKPRRIEIKLVAFAHHYA